jgi:hypothetical protein
MKTNTFVIIIFCLGMSLYSCKSFNSNLNIQKEIQEYVNQYFDSYKDIYSELKTQVDSMRILKTQSTLMNQFHEVKIDDFVIFNRDKTKLYTTLNSTTSEAINSTSDLIQSLYGVKIDGRWYVFLGKYNLVALRAGYKYDKYEPFTWEELSYVAHEQMFRRYISLDRKGNLVIDYEQLEADTDVQAITGKHPSMVESEEKEYIDLYYHYQNKIIDSTHLTQIYADIEAGKDKEREPVQKPGWVQRKLGIGVPIFESKAWKKHLEERRRE